MGLGIWSRRIGLGCLILFVALSVLGAIALVVDNKPSPSDTAAAPAQEAPPAAFIPDPRGVAFAKSMLLQDFQGYLEGKKVAGDWSQVQPIDERVTAVALHRAYTANEVTADDAFSGKSVAVTGVVVRTAKDAFGAPYVSLNSGNVFEHVEAGLADETIAKADTLVPGQRLLFICTGDGLVVTFVRLKDCQTESVLLDIKKPDIDNAIDQVLRGQGDGVSDRMKFLIGYIYVTGTSLPPDTPCGTVSSADIRACNRVYRAIPKTALAALYDKLAAQIGLPAQPKP